jgi:hypothetical protein
VEIVEALDHEALLLASAQGRQQHGREDADDGNDDQQFDQCEPEPSNPLFTVDLCALHIFLQI